MASRDTYFISHNGSDTSDCGGTVDSACFSLLHVLRLNCAHPPSKGLKIKTDKSIVIDNNLLVSLVSEIENMKQHIFFVLSTVLTLVSFRWSVKP